MAARSPTRPSISRRRRLSGNSPATLAVTGYASAPKITLSSIPILPQDEVLSQLLFNTSTSQLSPFQLARIATALASIAGVNTGGGAGGILGSVRQGLGLDELSIGSGMGNPTGAATANTTTSASRTESAPTLAGRAAMSPLAFMSARPRARPAGQAARPHRCRSTSQRA